ncbi:chromogranin-A [Ctenodactylus gundi]
MRSAAVLALLLCAGPVLTLPVNSPVNKGDSEVMKCIIEVISDSLSKPSPLPTRQECLEILREDARILSILRHQNLLKELQDLALQGAKERSQQQQKHSSFEEELSEVLENQSDQSRREGQSEEALALDGAGKTRAEEARPPKGKGEKDPSRPEEDEEEEAVAGAPAGPFQDGKSGEPEQEEPEQERLSREWEDTRRWSKMDQLAKELTAEKRLDREGEVDDPDRSMKLPFRTRAYGFQGPGPQLRRGWRPSSREDSIEAGLPLQARSFPEERREEEGSANRRAEDQELESLSAIEAELEKVAHQLQALRRG